MTSLLPLVFEIRSIHYQLLFFPCPLFIISSFIYRFSLYGEFLLGRYQSKQNFCLISGPRPVLCAHTSPEKASNEITIALSGIYWENEWPIMWDGNGIHIGLKPH